MAETTNQMASAGYSSFPRPRQASDEDAPPHQPSAQREEASSGDSTDSALTCLRAWRQPTVPPYSFISAQNREAVQKYDRGRGRDKSLFPPSDGPSDTPLDMLANPTGTYPSAAVMIDSISMADALGVVARSDDSVDVVDESTEPPFRYNGLTEDERASLDSPSGGVLYVRVERAPWAQEQENETTQEDLETEDSADKTGWNSIPYFPRAKELRSIAESVQWLESMASMSDSSVSSGHRSIGSSASGDARNKADSVEERENTNSILIVERALITSAKDRLQLVLEILTRSQSMVTETTRQLCELEIAKVKAQFAVDAAQAHRHAVEQDTEHTITTARRRQDTAENDADHAITAIELRRRDAEQNAKAAVELVTAHQQQVIRLIGEIERLTGQIKEARAEEAEARTTAEQMLALKVEIERQTQTNIRAAQEHCRVALTEAETLAHALRETRRQLTETKTALRQTEETFTIRLTGLTAVAQAAEQTCAVAQAQQETVVAKVAAAIETARARQADAEQRAKRVMEIMQTKARHACAEAEYTEAAAQRARVAAEIQRRKAEGIIAAIAEATAQAEVRWVEAQQAATKVSATMKHRLLEAEKTIIAARTQTSHTQEKYWQILEKAQSTLTTIEDRVFQAEKRQSSLKAAAAKAELRRMGAERALQEIVAARLREEQEIVSLRYERENLRAEIFHMTEEAIQYRRQILTRATISSYGIIEAAVRQAGSTIDQQSLYAIVIQILALLEAAMIPCGLPGLVGTT